MALSGINGINGLNGLSKKKEGKPDLLALARSIQHDAKAIAEFCDANGSPLPSLSQDFPDNLPENIQESRMKLREAAKAMNDIAAGPFDHLFSIAWSVRLPSLYNSARSANEYSTIRCRRYAGSSTSRSHRQWGCKEAFHTPTLRPLAE